MYSEILAAQPRIQKRAPVWQHICDAPRCGGNVAATLEQQTVELLRAIDTGSSAVWEHYLRADAVATDENGAVYTKPELVRQISPFPAGVSGKLALQDFHVRVAGSVAVATYIINEHEVFHGHSLHCQYRNMDTWVKDDAGWRLLAYQALALRTDPPSVPLSEKLMGEYVGRYALSPTKTYQIRMNDGHLEGQEAGRPPEKLLAEVADMLFVQTSHGIAKCFSVAPTATSPVSRKGEKPRIWCGHDRLSDPAAPQNSSAVLISRRHHACQRLNFFDLFFALCYLCIDSHGIGWNIHQKAICSRAHSKC